MSGNHPNATDGVVFNTIEEAIEDIRQGKLVIVVDDEDRENEGDFICAAEAVTPEIINFMSKYGRGLICTPIEEKRAKELELDMMVSSNTAMHETAFTISIDLIGKGCTTGISAYDRSTGIKALVDPATKPSDFARPGHIFPLKAKMGGVLRRTGHTEASVDLAKLAGFYPAGVLVEILDEDGSAARLPRLYEIAKQFDLKLIAIKHLVEYRLSNERLIKRERSFPMTTRYGEFTVHGYRQMTTNDVHLVLKKGHWKETDSVPVRVHSSAGAGHLFGSLLDDFDSALVNSLKILEKEEYGVIVLMRHAEKADFILDQLEAFAASQKNGGESKLVSAQRDFGIGAQILRDLDIAKIRLMTTNPKRRIALDGYGLEIVENIQV